MKMNNSHNWTVSRSETFWKDIAPGEHVLQVYEDTGSFINTLAAFVGTGINAGESVVIIAEPQHITQLEEKLQEHTLQLSTLVSDDRLIILDARQTLSSFMTDDAPDPEKFKTTIKKVVDRARGKLDRKVRAFGEMVAILWEAGNRTATIQLEELWNDFIKRERISLFCAYPKRVFGQAEHEIYNICQCHSKIIKDSKKPLTEVIYQNVAATG